ncbi:MAG TPA: hypothetical protein VG815_03100 [Chloroflexota bacterium]|jgi:hypothetical protein|nr:hypothetical protein [Candidatus Binataceae bacterium]HEV3309488.1 hypothetical protein [Chloroflexota bacterium]
MPERHALLPDEFAALEPFAADWVLRTERERYAKRLSSSMEQMQAFYDAAFARAEAAIKYLNQFELDDLPEQAQSLLFLLYSLVMVSFPVEVWKQPHVPDAGAAYLDLVEEPVP